MAKGVEYTVELVDKVTAPARKVSTSVDKIAKAIGATVDSAGRLRDVRGRFVQMKDAVDQVAKATAKADGEMAGFKKRLELVGKLGDKSKLNWTGRGGEALGSSLGRTGALRRQQALLQQTNGSLFGMAARAGAVLIAFQAISRAASAIARGLARGLALIVKTASWIQKTRIGFQMVAGGTAAGNAAMAKAIKLAKRYGLGVKKTTEQFKKLLAMQFTAGEASDIVKMAADMDALGMGADATDRVMRAMTQVRSKTKLQGEELMQLAEAGISMDLVYKALETQLGKNRKEIIRLQNAGKINDKQGLKAIKQAVLYKLRLSQLGQAADKQSKTLSGMFARLKSMGEASLIELAEKVMPGLQKAFAPIFREIMDWAKSAGAKRLLNDVASGVISIARAAAGAWPLVKELAAMLADLFAQGRGVSKVMAKTEKQIQALTGMEIGVFDGFLWAVYGIARALKLLFQLSAIFHAVFVAPLFRGLSLLGNLGQKILQFAQPLIEAAKSLGGAIVRGMVAGITGAASSLASAVSNAASRAIAAARSTLKVRSPSKVFEHIGTMTGLGFQRGLEGTQPAIASASANTFGARPGVGGSTVNQTNNSTINITEAQSAEETARQVKRLQLLEMANAFEQMALEVGAA